MAEDQQDLLPSYAESDSPQHGVTCRRGGILSALSIFVALLVAGQATTVYFLVQQHDQITKLKDFSNEMKMLSERMHSSHPDPQKKKQMVMMDRPFRLFDLDEQPPKLNRTEIESWMNEWLLLNSTVHPSPGDSEAETNDGTLIREPPALSKCQLEASGKGILHTLIDGFIPQCTSSGDYLAKQCHSSVGFCWCVYKNGTEIPGTRTRGLLDCIDIDDAEGSTFGLTDDDPWNV